MSSRPSTIWIGVTAICCALLVLSRYLGWDVAAGTAKMVASAGFLGVALSSGAGWTPYGKALMTGLMLSAVGDVLLIGDSAGNFLAGLLAFLAAHLAYVTAFWRRGLDSRTCGWSALVLAVAAVGVLAWLLPQVPGGLKVPVVAYTTVISVMLATAIGIRGAGGPWSITAGAALFYLSDLAVAADRFLDGSFPHYAWGLPLYYSGQLLLARTTRS